MFSILRTLNMEVLNYSYINTQPATRLSIVYQIYQTCRLHSIKD